jgi:hypothetical protein
VGHHVQYKERRAQGLKPLCNRDVKEQFAEDYAIRYIRAQGGIGYSNRSSSPLAGPSASAPSGTGGES